MRACLGGGSAATPDRVAAGGGAKWAPARRRRPRLGAGVQGPCTVIWLGGFMAQLQLDAPCPESPDGRAWVSWPLPVPGSLSVRLSTLPRKTPGVRLPRACSLAVLQASGPLQGTPASGAGRDGGSPPQGAPTLSPASHTVCCTPSSVPPHRRRICRAQNNPTMRLVPRLPRNVTEAGAAAEPL